MLATMDLQVSQIVTNVLQNSLVKLAKVNTNNRVHSRFLDQVGHETIGNKHFFTELV